MGYWISSTVDPAARSDDGPASPTSPAHSASKGAVEIPAPQAAARATPQGPLAAKSEAAKPAVSHDFNHIGGELARRLASLLAFLKPASGTDTHADRQGLSLCRTGLCWGSRLVLENLRVLEARFSFCSSSSFLQMKLQTWLIGGEQWILSRPQGCVRYFFGQL